MENALELWHCKVSVVKLREHMLLRFTDRANRPVFKDSRPFQDFDFAGLLSGATQDPTYLNRAREVVARMGFRLPLPIRIPAAAAIFKLEAFPAYSDWEQLGEHYSEEDYKSDLYLWTVNTTRPATFEALDEWLSKSALEAKYKPTIEDQAAYARSILRAFGDDERRLENYYGYSNPCIPASGGRLAKLMELAKAHVPEHKVNKKKTNAAASVNEPVEKTPKKKKAVDGQLSLWQST